MPVPTSDPRRECTRTAVLAGALIALTLTAGCGDDTTGTSTVRGATSADHRPTTTREAAPASTAARPPAAESDAASIVPHLTQRQRAGLRIIAPFRNGDGTMPPRLQAAIAAGRIGGVILFRENGTTRRRLRSLTQQLQAVPRPHALARVPLLIMVDQEGGEIRRLDDTPPRRSATDQARAGTAAIRRAGATSARALCRTGINVNLAPVADAGQPSGFMAKQQRTYGGNAAEAGTNAATFVTAAQGAGIATVAKHFPGLGRAVGNTDLGPEAIDASVTALRHTDIAAFAPAVDAGVDLVMLANAVYPAFDDVPAGLSRRIVRTELRRRLGFDGVTISDDLEAGALRNGHTTASVAKDAARAGIDLLLYGIRTQAALDASDALADSVPSDSKSRKTAERIVNLRLRLMRTCG